MIKIVIKHLVRPVNETGNVSDKSWDDAIVSTVHASSKLNAERRIVSSIGNPPQGKHYIFKVISTETVGSGYETLREYVRYAHGGNKTEAAASLEVTLGEVVDNWRHGVVINGYLYASKRLNNFTAQEDANENLEALR